MTRLHTTGKNPMTPVHPERQLQIGELAAQLGINPKTIRYYEHIGLLPLPKRTEAGYRLYDAADRELLRFIGRAKVLGLKLEEIREILDIRREGELPCERVVTLLEQKIAAIEDQLRVLSEFQQELRALRATADQIITPQACICGIIEYQEI